MKRNTFWLIVIIILVILALVLFFYPKPVEICPPQTGHCDLMCNGCLGFVHVTIEQAQQGYIYCFGMPYKCKK